MTSTHHKSKTPAYMFMRYHKAIQKCIETGKSRVAAAFAVTGYNKALMALNDEVKRLSDKEV